MTALPPPDMRGGSRFGGRLRRDRTSPTGYRTATAEKRCYKCQEERPGALVEKLPPGYRCRDREGCLERQMVAGILRPGDAGWERAVELLGGTPEGV